jgi:hypothetical protein
MARKTYIVKAGDTLDNVSRQFYGVANEKERIVQNNGFLQWRRSSGDSLLDGTPNLHAGDVLVVTTDNPTSSAPKGVGAEDVTLYLDGNKTSLPEGSILTKHYDACCHTFSSTFGWDPNSDYDRALWVPNDAAECDLYIGEKQHFGGKFEKTKNITGIDTSRMAAAARTHTRLLHKSVIPSLNYPVERENQDLFQIMDWGTNIWGLYVEQLGDDTDVFKKVSAKKTEKVFSFFNRLANTRGRVLSPSNDGYGLIINNPLDGDSVGRYVEGEAGFDPPEIEFDTSGLQGTYLSSTRRASKAANLALYRDPNFPEQSYSYEEISGAKKGDIQAALEYVALKKYRDFFTVPFFPGGGLLNPQGDVWDVGQKITLNAPSSRIYQDMQFIVRSVTFDLDPDVRRATLEIVPPEVYLSQNIDLKMWIR